MPKRGYFSLVVALGIGWSWLFPLWGFPRQHVSRHEAKPKKDLSTLIRDAEDTTYRFYWRRLGAIHQLGQSLDSPRTLTTLLHLLQDPEYPIQEAAELALEKTQGSKNRLLIALDGLQDSHSLSQQFNTVDILSVFLQANDLSHEEKEKIQNDLLHTLLKTSVEALQEEILKVLLQTRTVPSSHELPSFQRLLQDSHPEIQALALRWLGVVRSETVQNQLSAKRQSFFWPVRSAAFEVLCGSWLAPCDRAAQDLLHDQDYQVKIDLLDFLKTVSIPGEENHAKAREAAKKLLTDPNWKVRAAAVQVLKEVGTLDDVPALLDRLRQDKTRLRFDVAEALKALTGADVGYQYEPWQKWYQAYSKREASPQAGVDVRTPSDEYKTAIVSYYSLPVLGSRIAFVIDMSGSMLEKETLTVRGKAEEHTKADLALNELSRTLQKLPEWTSFNILIMNTEAQKQGVRQFSTTLVQATPSNVRQAIQFTNLAWKKLSALWRGRGDLYDVLQEAMQFKDIDSVYLLSDGVPTYGRYINPSRILQHIQALNHYERIALFTILTGKKGTNESFLRQLADQNGGLFTTASLK